MFPKQFYNDCDVLFVVKIPPLTPCLLLPTLSLSYSLTAVSAREIKTVYCQSKRNTICVLDQVREKTPLSAHAGMERNRKMNRRQRQKG